MGKDILNVEVLVPQLSTTYLICWRDSICVPVLHYSFFIVCRAKPSTNWLPDLLPRLRGDQKKLRYRSNKSR